MYLHVLRVVPLMCDRHLTLHNRTGNALSKRGAAHRDMLPLYERRNTTPRQQRLKWKGSNDYAYCKFFHVSYAPHAVPPMSVQMIEMHEPHAVLYALSCSRLCLDGDANLVSGGRGGNKLGGSVWIGKEYARSLRCLVWRASHPGVLGLIEF